MESFLSAHELSALMLIEQAASNANLDLGEVEQLISRRLVERATGGCGSPELKVTNSGTAMLARMCSYDTRPK